MRGNSTSTFACTKTGWYKVDLWFGGVLAARVWFAYAREGGFGNFGNVYTETANRRLGLLGELMAPCMADFDAAGDARILCCGSGNRFAARAVSLVLAVAPWARPYLGKRHPFALKGRDASTTRPPQRLNMRLLTGGEGLW